MFPINPGKSVINSVNDKGISVKKNYDTVWKIQKCNHHHPLSVGLVLENTFTELRSRKTEFFETKGNLAYGWATY
jgi:hypothetical protein